MKTLVIGANGKIGRIFCKLANDQRLNVVAMLRDEKQRPYFDDLGIESVIADLENDFSSSLSGCEQVVFTAGSGGHTGGDKTLLIDLYAATRAIDYAKESCKHFVMISALKADDPMLSKNIRHYLVAKKFADDHLKESGLGYTILRPGRLTDEPASGKVNTEIKKGGSISRENVALTMIAALKTGASNKTIDLLDGDTPIDNVFS